MGAAAQAVVVAQETIEISREPQEDLNAETLGLIEGGAMLSSTEPSNLQVKDHPAEDRSTLLLLSNLLQPWSI